MQKLKTFFYSLFNSLTNPSYYRDIIKVSASFSWKYFLFLNFLLSLVIVGRFLVPVFSFNITEAIDQGFALYPEELVITGDETGLSVNQELPYSIPFPAELFDDLPDQTRDNTSGVTLDEIKGLSFITFDSNESVTGIQDFYVAKSYIVMTESTIYVLHDVDPGEVRLYPMPEFDQPFEISSLILQELRDTIITHPFISQKIYIWVVAAVALIFFFPIMTLVRVLTATFYSIAAWLVAKFLFKKLQLTYGKVVQLSFHSLTLVILAAMVGEITDWYQLIGWEYFLAYLFWTGFIFFTINKPSTSLRRSNSKPATSTKKSTQKKSVKKTKSKTKKKTPSKKK